MRVCKWDHAAMIKMTKGSTGGNITTMTLKCKNKKRERRERVRKRERGLDGGMSGSGGGERKHE